MTDKLTACGIVVVSVLVLTIFHVRNQRNELEYQLQQANAKIQQYEQAAQMEAEYRQKAALLMKEMENESRRNRERAEKVLKDNTDWSNCLLPDDVIGLLNTDNSASDVSDASGATCPGKDTVNDGTEH